MKHLLRSAAEFSLRRLPVSRAVYRQRDEALAESARLAALLADATAPRLEMASDHHGDALSAVAQIHPHRDARLEAAVPVCRTPEERILIATRCRDADTLPKVPGAGTVTQGPDGMPVQRMFNGVQVLAGGYYGAWMQELISRCEGHHEPQEEVLFAEILRQLGPSATMLELGGFWSFYSISFLAGYPGRRSLVVEADPRHLEVGRTNARLNNCAPHFLNAYVGPQAAPPLPFQTESSGLVDLPCVSVESLMTANGIDHLDVLHCDAQGAELAVLESCVPLFAAGRIGWVVVSTHTHHISGDPLTHQRCLAVLDRAGAHVLAEHDVQESFSGDGLIVARFGTVPTGWKTPKLSYNRASESLFRNPLYDLAAAKG